MRTVGSTAEQTQKAIKESAIALFSKHGYQAVTLRMLAQEIGLQAGSLYNHIENKQDLLANILREIMEELFEIMSDALSGIDDPKERLRAFIRVHVEYHTIRKDEFFIGNMELRNLTPDNYEKVVAVRDRYEKIVGDILKKGIDAGVFTVGDPKLTRFAILSMLSDIATWYRPGGRLSKDNIAQKFTLLIERMLKVRGS